MPSPPRSRLGRRAGVDLLAVERGAGSASRALRIARFYGAPTSLPNARRPASLAARLLGSDSVHGRRVDGSGRRHLALRVVVAAGPPIKPSGLATCSAGAPPRTARPSAVGRRAPRPLVRCGRTTPPAPGERERSAPISRSKARPRPQRAQAHRASASVGRRRLAVQRAAPSSDLGVTPARADSAVRGALQAMKSSGPASSASRARRSRSARRSRISMCSPS